ncbi:hypothetical protein OIU74_028608, partial [Salix koriyanagi]
MKFKLRICCIGINPKKLMVFGFTIDVNVRMLPTFLLGSLVLTQRFLQSQN